MIKNLILGFFLGLLATLTYVQYDPWVHEQVGALFADSFGDMFNCKVSGAVRLVNFLSPEIVFDQFCVSDKQSQIPAWKWKAKTYKTGFSWLDLIVHGAIRLWVVADKLEVSSATSDDGVAIVSHIQDLLSPPNFPIPLILQHTYFNNANTQLILPQGICSFNWQSDSHHAQDKFRSHFFIESGSFLQQERNILEGAKGKITLDTFPDNTADMQVEMQGDLVGLTDHSTCVLRGRWNKTHGRFVAQTVDRAIAVDPIILTQKNNKQWIELKGHVPASYLAYLLTNKSIALQGDCVIALSGTLEDPVFLDGRFIVEHLRHPLLLEDSASVISFHKRGAKWFGALDIKLPEQIALHGTGNWNDERGKGSLEIKNSSPLSWARYPYWHVGRDQTCCTIAIDSKKIVAHIAGDIKNSLHKDQIDVAGAITIERPTGIFDSSGSIRDHTFKGSGILGSYPYITQLNYYRDPHNPVLKVGYNTDEDVYRGIINIAALRALINHMVSFDLQGEGAFQFDTKFTQNIIDTTFHLKDGTIRLPQTFNFINGIDGQLLIDREHYIMRCRDVRCALHTGSFSIPYGRVSLDSSGNLDFSYLPILFDHCLLNLKRDLFALMSGELCFSKKRDTMPMIKGNLILDRSQLKENIFSDRFQKSLFSATDAMQTAQGVALACDLRVQTKDPIRIATGFLDAHAQVDLTIQKEVSEPEIKGSINLLSGLLDFPYKPLHISRGTITFAKDQPLNPFVELVAKNNIKRHNIGLQVSGTLRDHFVMLESSPPLTDEQIIGLLLAGSHEESLGVVIPTLLVQNMTNIIFNADQTGFLERYVKPWLKQINVHFVPKFSEESGRGGLRGALEIDVNERWRALIEKNFSLTEDTRFELEYLLSDEVRFRLMRDERCDVGGEVEMKWKFR